MSRFPVSRDTSVCPWILLVACLAWAIAPSSAAAQPVPSSPADSTLQLSSLLQDATEANPSLRAARLKADALRSRPEQVRALPDPTVSAGVFPYPILTARGAQRSRWQVQQSVPFPGTRALREDVAALRADASKADADALALALAFRIRRAYYTLYRVQEERRVIQAFQSTLQQFEDAALAQYEVGTEEQPAVLKAQIERERLQLRLETLDAERHSALQTLARLTGRPSLPKGPAQISPASYAAASPVVDAPMQRPEAVSLQADVERASKEIALAKKDARPDFTVGVQYVDVAERDFTPTMNGRDALALSVGVQVPLWRGKQRAQVEQAQVERQRARAALEAFELEVQTQLDDLRRQVDRQRAQLTLLDDRLIPKAETALDATLSAYQTGSTGFLDLLDAQRTLFQLRLQRIGIHTRLLQTTAELKRVAGQSSLPGATVR